MGPVVHVEMYCPDNPARRDRYPAAASASTCCSFRVSLSCRATLPEITVHIWPYVLTEVGDTSALPCPVATGQAQGITGASCIGQYFVQLLMPIDFFLCSALLSPPSLHRDRFLIFCTPNHLSMENLTCNKDMIQELDLQQN